MTQPSITYRWPVTRSLLPKPAFAWDFKLGVLTPQRGAGTFVCTRATQKWVMGTNGLLQLIAVDAPPFNVSAIDGMMRIRPEEAATQLLVAATSRDLTQAQWVKVNGTAAKDQVGADGVVNAASLFTATSPNATCLQTVTAAATNRVFSLRVRRITGTGVVTISGDNFSTSTDITALINNTTYTRVFLNPASVLNPIVGIKLATSGDKVAVDFVNLVAATCLSSDLDSVVATRNADVIVLNPFSMTLPCTIVVKGMMHEVDGTLDTNGRFMFTISDGTANEVIRFQRAASSQALSPVIIDGGVSQLAGVARSVGPNTRVACACAIETNDVAGSINGQAVQTDSSVTLPTVNRIHLGSNNAGSASFWCAGIESLMIWNTRLPNSMLPQLCEASF
ncbi:MAG TPA: hypothetical protein VF077_13360 [Nitrospiraceae bacterium]